MGVYFLEQQLWSLKGGGGGGVGGGGGGGKWVNFSTQPVLAVLLLT